MLVFLIVILFRGHHWKGIATKSLHIKNICFNEKKSILNTQEVLNNPYKYIFKIFCLPFSELPPTSLFLYFKYVLIHLLILKWTILVTSYNLWTNLHGHKRSSLFVRMPDNIRKKFYNIDTKIPVSLRSTDKLRMAMLSATYWKKKFNI
jgi:hypothetical protein